MVRFENGKTEERTIRGIDLQQGVQIPQQLPNNLEQNQIQEENNNDDSSSDESQSVNSQEAEEPPVPLLALLSNPEDRPPIPVGAIQVHDRLWINEAVLIDPAGNLGVYQDITRLNCLEDCVEFDNRRPN